jgi:hypothetical protein
VTDLFKQIQSPSSVKLCTFEFTYPRTPPPGCDRQPLSWKLTGLQNVCIDEAWNQETSTPNSILEQNLERLKRYLNSGICPPQ